MQSKPDEKLKRTVLVSLVCLGLVMALGALSKRSRAQRFRASLGTFHSQGPIPFFIADGTGVPGYEPSDRELAKMAFQAWSAESGEKIRFVETNNENKALIRLRWVSAQEGFFGEMQRVQVNGRAGAIVFVMPDVKQLGVPLAERAVADKLLRDTIVYLTCVHELGHAVGLAHTKDYDDIMFFFGYGGDTVEYFLRYRRKLQARSDIARHSGLSPADVRTLRSLY